MAKKDRQESAAKMLRQFDALKEKHPDALLLFRTGDFYEAYGKDAVKAAAILAVEITDRILPDRKLQVASFPVSELDTNLPKLIRSGARVALCDQISDDVRKKADKQDIGQTISNDTDMERKKKTQQAQEEPAPTAKNTAGEKPARGKSTGQKVGTEQNATSGQKTDVAEKSEAKTERKPREPQMVTVDGGKVTHGHAYQSKTNPEDWYFTARIDGKQLKPQRMDAADLAAYQKKEMTVPELMQRYYPTKLMPKVPEESFKFPKQMEGPEGTVAIEKFNVYKEKDVGRADYGKYKFYAQVGEARMSAVASRRDLNAYFDRVTTPVQLVEKNFGERLHLKSAYEKYRLPEGVDLKGVRVAKDRADNKWKVSADLGDRGQTAKHEISFDDGYSLFKAKTATREQIAAKYLNAEIKGLLAAPAVKAEKSVSMKM